MSINPNGFEPRNNNAPQGFDTLQIPQLQPAPTPPEQPPQEPTVATPEQDPRALITEIRSYNRYLEQLRAQELKDKAQPQGDV